MDREIKSISEEYAISLKIIDVVKHPLLTLKNGVKWIPALKIGENIYYGKDLSRENLIKQIKENQSFE